MMFAREMFYYSFICYQWLFTRISGIYGGERDWPHLFVFIIVQLPVVKVLQNAKRLWTNCMTVNYQFQTSRQATISTDEEIEN